MASDVTACTDSGDCYTLLAEINDGEISLLNFPNGGYIDIYGAEIDENGEAFGSDDDYRDWSFTIDEYIIDQALDDWAYYNDIELE